MLSEMSALILRLGYTISYNSALLKIVIIFHIYVNKQYCIGNYHEIPAINHLADHLADQNQIIFQKP